jgi:hypothetical protein
VQTGPGIQTASPWSDECLNYSEHNITRVRFCVAHWQCARWYAKLQGGGLSCSSRWFISIWLMYAQTERACLSLCLSPLAAAVYARHHGSRASFVLPHWHLHTRAAREMHSGGCNYDERVTGRLLRISWMCVVTIAKNGIRDSWRTGTCNFSKVSKCALEQKNCDFSIRVISTSCAACAYMSRWLFRLNCIQR